MLVEALVSGYTMMLLVKFKVGMVAKLYYKLDVKLVPSMAAITSYMTLVQ